MNSAQLDGGKGCVVIETVLDFPTRYPVSEQVEQSAGMIDGCHADLKQGNS